jgi:hypothetical protein
MAAGEERGEDFLNDTVLTDDRATELGPQARRDRCASSNDIDDMKPKLYSGCAVTGVRAQWVPPGRGSPLSRRLALVSAGNSSPPDGTGRTAIR